MNNAGLASLLALQNAAQVSDVCLCSKADDNPDDNPSSYNRNIIPKLKEVHHTEYLHIQGKVVVSGESSSDDTDSYLL